MVRHENADFPDSWDYSIRMRRKHVPFLRAFFGVFTILGVAMLLLLGVGAADRANDLRVQATVESELPGGHRNCHKYRMSYSTPEGRSRSVAMCSKYDRLGVGQPVTVRYSPESPTGDIALDGEDSLVLVLLTLGAALVFAVGVTGSWFAWRRPESLLRLGLRF
ncbi:DUF3592 domain-containing protein [Actinosynnema sp. NPDC023794]